jgi:hypothetical protein
MGGISEHGIYAALHMSFFPPSGGWDNLGSPQGLIVYNLLYVFYVFYSFLLFIACTTTILSHTGIIYTKNRDLYCCTAFCLCIPLLLRTYILQLALQSCMASRVAPDLGSRYAPKMLHITTLGALDPEFLDLSNPIYLFD